MINDAQHGMKPEKAARKTTKERSYHELTRFLRATAADRNLFCPFDGIRERWSSGSSYLTKPLHREETATSATYSVLDSPACQPY
jgi:hypothetical protein